MEQWSAFSPGSQTSTQTMLGTALLLWHWRGNSRIILIYLVYSAIDTSPWKQVENYFPRKESGRGALGQWMCRRCWCLEHAQSPRGLQPGGGIRTPLVTSQAPKSAVIHLIPMCHKPFPFPAFWKGTGQKNHGVFPVWVWSGFICPWQTGAVVKCYFALSGVWVCSHHRVCHWFLHNLQWPGHFPQAGQLRFPRGAQDRRWVEFLLAKWAAVWDFPPQFTLCREQELLLSKSSFYSWACLRQLCSVRKLQMEFQWFMKITCEPGMWSFSEFHNI